MADHIKSTVANRLGCLTIDRPRALNALSLDMVRAITAILTAWRDDAAIDAVVIRGSEGRAFCAGGDIRYFYQVANATPLGGSASLEDFFTEEYALNYLIHFFPKPYIAFMDGIVMGGGMGISQSGPAQRMRVVTQRTKMAMPEVNIGLFPDVGGSYFLPRARGCTGIYLGLTGHVIDGVQAVNAALADVLIPHEQLDALQQRLASEPVSQWRETVAAFETPRTDSENRSSPDLAEHDKAIDHHFSLSSVVAIMASLEQDDTPFAQAALTSMRKRSPLMLCVTLEQLQRGAGMILGDCLRMERSMVRHCFEHSDLVEGIRAAVIDKDDAPRWSPASISAVQPEQVARFFEPVWPGSAHPLRFLS